MSAIYVCPKSKVPSVTQQIRPSHLITLLDPRDEMPTPDDILAHRHLKLGMHDISTSAPEYTAPDELHVRELLAFAKDWQRQQPLLIHCWAGISRSTASAFAIACMLTDPGNEKELALLLRQRAPHAQPNLRIVAFADKLLDRNGRMVDAVDAMGRGRSVVEGTTFSLPLA